MKKIYFVRHGESVENVTGIFTDGDAPLTEIGQKQANLVARRFKNLPIDIVYSSKFTRAGQTAEAIADCNNFKIKVLDFVHEYSHYAKEHLNKNRSDEDLVIHNKLIKEAWKNNDIKTSFGGESIEDVMYRIKQLVEFINNSEHVHIVVVSHKNFFGKLLGAVLTGNYFDAKTIINLQRHLSMSNTGLTVFNVGSDNKWKLQQWNDDAHLGELDILDDITIKPVKPIMEFAGKFKE